MTCREFAEFLYAYINGEVAAEAAAEFERHLQVCEACRNYLDTYKKTIALGKGAFQQKQGGVPADVPARLVQAILAARKKAGS